MLRMNIWGMDMEMLMLWKLGSFDRCNVMGECGNGGMLGVNFFIGAMLGVNVLIGVMLGVNVRNECFDRCNLMLRMNIWGMNMEMLMLGMLWSFYRCKYMNEC